MHRPSGGAVRLRALAVGSANGDRRAARAPVAVIFREGTVLARPVVAAFRLRSPANPRGQSVIACPPCADEALSSVPEDGIRA